MAAPTIVGTAVWDTGGTAQQSHFARMPAGVQAGDLLLVCAAFFNGQSHPIDAKWTALPALAPGSAFAANTPAQAFYAIAAGGEAGDWPLYTFAASARHGAAFTYALRGYADVPVDAGAWISTAGSTTVDPPALTPPAGLADYLWLVFATTGVGNPSRVLTPPAGFGAVLTDNGNLGVNLSAAVCSQALTAASLDPGLASWSGAADDPQALTLAVQGIAAGSAQPNFGAIVG